MEFRACCERRCDAGGSIVKEGIRVVKEEVGWGREGGGLDLGWARMVDRGMMKMIPPLMVL